MDSQDLLTPADRKIIERTHQYIQEHPCPAHEWMFLLVGFIRGAFPFLRKETGEEFEPLALEFARKVHWWNDPEYLRWDDADSVRLEFAKAWEKRKHVQGSQFLKIALDASHEDWFGLSENHNGWVARVATAGFCLQEMKPGTPFLIPVNPKTASFLNITPRTLGCAIEQAIKKDFLKVTYKGCANPANRKARRFVFNTDHPEVVDRLQEAQEAAFMKTLELAHAPEPDPDYDWLEDA